MHELLIRLARSTAEFCFAFVCLFVQQYYKTRKSLLYPRRYETSSVGQRGSVGLEVVGSFQAKAQKFENSNLHGFELHKPSSKNTKLLFQVIKAIINQLAPTLCSK